MLPWVHTSHIAQHPCIEGTHKLGQGSSIVGMLDNVPSAATRCSDLPPREHPLLVRMHKQVGYSHRRKDYMGDMDTPRQGAKEKEHTK